MASIRCGNCKSTHTSPALVKACYFPDSSAPAARTMAKEELRSTYETKGTAYQPKAKRESTTKWAKSNVDTNWSHDTNRGEFPARQPGNLITRKQADFAFSLMNDIAAMLGKSPLEDQDGFYEMVKGVSRIKGSEMITSLKVERDKLKVEKPAAAAPVAPATGAKVSDGRYAVEHQGVLKFYKVNTPTDGRWAGFTFVDVYASDERHAIRNRATRNEILALIAVDETGAAQRYGQEIGKCGRCGRTLTDETSRARGIGPDCAEAMGIL